MLESLHIRNLALIDDMSLDFGPGINVLTGESGAGKSFILKAINFVLGEKLPPDIVRPGAEKAQVEALFTLTSGDLVLRRELAAASGRSRFYINDAISSQDALRNLRPQLLSHTSQHAQQKLTSPAYQAALLEGDLAESEAAIQKEKILTALKEVEKKISDLQKTRKDLAEKRELLEMQAAEIEKVDPKEGEEEKLEEQRAKARAAVSERQIYNKAMSLLHGDDGPGLLALAGDLEKLLQNLSLDDETWKNDLETVSGFRQELAHLAQQFRRPAPSGAKINMDAVESRLFALAQLKRKLKRSLPEILNLKQEIADNLSFLDVCALDLSHMNKEKKKLLGELQARIDELAPLRKIRAAAFTRDLEVQLKELGFSEHVKVEADFEKQEIWPGVFENRGRIFWAPNPGQNIQPLDKIASGGELSRFLLALNALAAKRDDITYIFDEIDAGVGGLTLNKVSDKLEDFSRDHQIILITHWPQLAARAARHFQIAKVVENSETFTKCRQLNKNERAKELARMAGGGEKGQTLAKNLLEAQ